MMYGTMKCGCVASVDLVGWALMARNWEIYYCPRHAAADEMYEALKSRHSYDVNQYWKRPKYPRRFWVRYRRLIHGKERAALALADGD